MPSISSESELAVVAHLLPFLPREPPQQRHSQLRALQEIRCERRSPWRLQTLVWFILILYKSTLSLAQQGVDLFNWVRYSLTLTINRQAYLLFYTKWQNASYPFFWEFLRQYVSLMNDVDLGDVDPGEHIHFGHLIGRNLTWFSTVLSSQWTFGLIHLPGVSCQTPCPGDTDTPVRPREQERLPISL